MSIKITIITVSLNSEKYISTAINSVLSQSYSNIEYIVVDGGSTDGTLDIVKSYGARISNIISESDDGLYDAMNKGIKASTGEVIGFLNSDDFYVDNLVIFRVAQLYQDNPNLDIALGDVDFICPGSQNKITRTFSSFGFAPWKLRFGLMPPHPSSFISRSAYHLVGRYSLGYIIAADFEWFCRALLVYNLKYLRINRVLVRMRTGGVSTSGMKSYYISSLEMLRALKNNNIYSNFLFVLFRLPVKFILKHKNK